jgi:MbtH protein
LVRLVAGTLGHPPAADCLGRLRDSGIAHRNEDHMANPFEEPDASYRVLVNDEGQHSLWPATQPTPHGWTVAHDTDSRASCLEYIERNWTDMRPKSLIEAQGG